MNTTSRIAGPGRSLNPLLAALLLLGYATATAQEPPRAVKVQDLSRILLQQSEDAAIQALENSTLTAEQLGAYTYLSKFTALHTAVKTNHERFVEALLRKGADPNRASPYEAPLHLAAHTGNVAIATRLLDAGAHVDLTDMNGDTPLFVAIESGHEEAASVLIARGADWRFVNQWNVTPVQIAASSDAAQVLTFMLDNGIDPAERAGDFQRPLLFWAAEGGARHTTQLIIDAGAVVTETDRFGYQPLMVAAAAPHSRDCIQALIARGADPNARQAKTGWTALHFAALAGEAEAVDALCLAGADPNARDRAGRTPLHMAVIGGKSPNAAALLMLRSDPQAQDLQGNTPMHFATLRKDAAMVRVLGDADLDLNLTDEQGKTPIDWARAIDDPDLRAAYQAIGFNLDKRDPTEPSNLLQSFREKVQRDNHPNGARNEVAESRDYGVLSVLVRRGDIESLQRLLEEGNDPDETHHASGWTALHFAAASGNEAAVRLLLAHGADANRRDGMGRTPLHIAAITRQRAVYDLLRTEGHAELALDGEEHDPQAYWDIAPMAEPAPLYYGFFPASNLKADYRNP